MRVDYQAPVEAFRGRLNNIIFQNYRTLHTGRRFQQPRDPNTPAQQAVRQRMINANLGWQVEMAATLVDWERYAEFVGGNPRTLFIGNWLHLAADEPDETGTAFLPPTTQPGILRAAAIRTSGNNILFDTQRPTISNPQITGYNALTAILRTNIPTSEPAPNLSSPNLITLNSGFDKQDWQLPNNNPVTRTVTFPANGMWRIAGLTYLFFNTSATTFWFLRGVSAVI